MSTAIQDEVWGFLALREVFLHLFDLEARPVSDVAWREPTIQAYVALTGVRRLGVVLSCTPTLASTLASKLFDCLPEEVSDAERIDAMGETANVIAGRVKADFCPQAHIGLPAISAQEIGFVHISGARLCSSINAAFGSQRMSIAVYEEVGS